MKKNKTNKSSKITKKHSPNLHSNNDTKGAYNLEDYRNKKRNYYNPYATPSNVASTKRERTTSNPYRNQYDRSKNSLYESPYQDTYSTASSNRQSNNQGYNSPHMPSYNDSYNTRQIGPNVSYKQIAAEKSPEQRKAEIRSKNKMTRKQVQQQNKKRKNRMIKKAIIGMVIIMFITYASIKTIDMFRYPSVSYQTVQLGVIDNSNIFQGIISREEKVFNSTRTGDIHYILSEGEKVATQGSICLVAKSDEIESLKKQLYTLDYDLYNKQEKRSDLSYYQADLYQINEVLKTELDQFVDSRYWDNPKSVYELRQSLDKTIEDRTALYIQDESKATEGMKGERQELVSSLKNNQSAQKASVSGIVSYTLDGYEDKLSKEALSQMSYEQYKELLASTKKLELSLPHLQAEANTPLYKIVTDNKWQLVTYVDSQEAASYNVGTYYNVYFEESKQERVRFKLDEKLEEGVMTKLVLSSSDYVADFLPHRAIEFSIGQNRAEGLKIPLKAIVERNMLAIPNTYLVEQGSEKGVLMKQNQANVFVPVHIQYSDDDFSYIMQQIDNLESVGLGSVIESPQGSTSHTISDIQTTQGVYVVNGQFAQFKRIDVELSNDEYAILSKGKETKLKEFDQIISNPKHIKEDQLLKYMNVQNE